MTFHSKATLADNIWWTERRSRGTKEKGNRWTHGTELRSGFPTPDKRHTCQSLSAASTEPMRLVGGGGGAKNWVKTHWQMVSVVRRGGRRKRKNAEGLVQWQLHLHWWVRWGWSGWLGLQCAVTTPQECNGHQEHCFTCTTTSNVVVDGRTERKPSFPVLRILHATITWNWSVHGKKSCDESC